MEDAFPSLVVFALPLLEPVVLRSGAARFSLLLLLSSSAWAPSKPGWAVGWGLWVGRTWLGVTGLRPKPSADAALDLKLRIEGSSGSPIGFGVRICEGGRSTSKMYSMVAGQSKWPRK